MENDIFLFLFRELTLSKEEIEKIKKTKEVKKLSVCAAFEQSKSVRKKELLRSLGRYYNLKYILLSRIEFSAAVLALFPKYLAKKHNMIPIERKDNYLTVAISDPSQVEVIDNLRFNTGLFIKLIFALESDITLAIERAYGQSKIDFRKGDFADKKRTEKQSQKRIKISEEDKGEAPIVKLVNDILISCIHQKSSDIHFEAYEHHLRVRFRTNGMLHEVAVPPIHVKDALISRIKIMSNLDIAETRLPQDGALKIEVDGREIAFRVSSVPCINGEKIVLRILDNSQLTTDIRDLGFDKKQLNMFLKVLESTTGIILVTGPTGSGKTTTLYSALTKMNSQDVNIVTAEDPVEFVVPNVNQVHVKPSIGFTFASALRAFLRQDPDIIMVGEIRDLETADIAIKASLTGHLVLSTLHTNSAPDTLSRLLNMGVAPFNITASVRCIIAQRLMRKICPCCKVEDESVTRKQLITIGVPIKYVDRIKCFKGKGCSRCYGTGVDGRVAIYEILIMNNDLKNLIISNASTNEIKEAAIKSGMKTLRQSAIKKMVNGLTTVSEIIRVTDPDYDIDNTDNEVHTGFFSINKKKKAR